MHIDYGSLCTGFELTILLARCLFSQKRISYVLGCKPQYSRCAIRWVVSFYFLLYNWIYMVLVHSEQMTRWDMDFGVSPSSLFRGLYLSVNCRDLL